MGSSSPRGYGSPSLAGSGSGIPRKGRSYDGALFSSGGSVLGSGS